MNLSSLPVFEAALQLSEEDRLQLASELLGSVSPDSGLWGLDAPEFLDELDRRMQDGTL